MPIRTGCGDLGERAHVRLGCSTTYREPMNGVRARKVEEYDWVRQREPDLFEGIVAKVAAGQWVLVWSGRGRGRMNLPFGQSIAATIHGQRSAPPSTGVDGAEVWDLMYR